jgi:hypothetical protein
MSSTRFTSATAMPKSHLVEKTFISSAPLVQKARRNLPEIDWTQQESPNETTTTPSEVSSQMSHDDNSSDTTSVATSEQDDFQTVSRRHNSKKNKKSAAPPEIDISKIRRCLKYIYQVIIISFCHDDKELPRFIKTPDHPQYPLGFVAALMRALRGFGLCLEEIFEAVFVPKNQGNPLLDGDSWKQKLPAFVKLITTPNTPLTKWIYWMVKNVGPDVIGHFDNQNGLTYIGPSDDDDFDIKVNSKGHFEMKKVIMQIAYLCCILWSLFLKHLEGEDITKYNFVKK